MFRSVNMDMKNATRQPTEQDQVQYRPDAYKAFKLQNKHSFYIQSTLFRREFILPASDNAKTSLLTRPFRKRSFVYGEVILISGSRRLIRNHEKCRDMVGKDYPTLPMKQASHSQDVVICCGI